MRSELIHLSDKLALVEELWSPRMVEQVNDMHVKVVRALGEFPAHTHEDTDELFLVLSGRLRIELPDRTVDLAEGDLFVVPRGVRHRPTASEECHMLLLEPAGTVNTGDAEAQGTAGEWI
jgi:mannose-6-phosphate isomerase-like protein (cupin superfamily)